jgi:predicted acetyltransferase
MVGDEFIFQHLENEEDIAQDLETVRNVFGTKSGADELLKKLFYKHPDMTLKNHFVIKHRDRIVSTLNLIPMTWSVGGVLLKVAEMGCVATLAEYRNSGLCRRLTNEFHKTVAEQEFDLSAIEGIPFFYRQFGYEYAVPLDEETRLPLNKIPDYKPKHKIRSFTEGDIPEAMQLLSRTQQKFYVHSVRGGQIWKMQQETGMVWEHLFEGYAVEIDGKMVAYFRVCYNAENKELLLREITDVTLALSQTILAFLKNLGKQHGLETLVSRISRHEFFTEQLICLGGVYSHPYAWQIRITDYAKILTKMKSLFEMRLSQSEFRNLTEKLNLNFRRFTVQMTVDNGKVTDVQRLETCEDRTIGLNPLVFTKFLLGHRSREELEAEYPDFWIRPTHKELIDVLFPKLPKSYIHVVY